MSARTLLLASALLCTPAARAGDPVAVELLEGPIPAKSWDLSKAAVADRFAEPAFALVGSPTK